MVRPRINPAYGAIIAKLARYFRALAIRVHRRLAGINGAAHFLQPQFNAVEQCFKCGARQRLDGALAQRAVLVQPVIELVGGPGAVEPRQRPGVKPPRVPICQTPRAGGRIGMRDGLTPARCRCSTVPGPPTSSITG